MERVAARAASVRRRSVLLQSNDQPARDRQLVAKRRRLHDFQHALQTGARQSSSQLTLNKFYYLTNSFSL